MWFRPAHSVALVAAALALAIVSGLGSGIHAQSKTATFDPLIVDVQVTPKKEGKIEALEATNFKVKFAGKSQKVLTAKFEHFDEGDVTPNIRPEQARPECVFGFLRRVGWPTAHYILTVSMPEPNPSQASQLRITLGTSKFAVDRFAYRTARR